MYLYTILVLSSYSFDMNVNAKVLSITFLYGCKGMDYDMISTFPKSSHFERHATTFLLLDVRYLTNETHIFEAILIL